MCSTLSTRLSRATVCPQNGRMCEKCLRAAVGATCSHCRKHRTVNFMTLDRDPLCKACCANPEANHSCPDCGCSVNGSGDYPCMSCGIKRTNVARQMGAQHLLTQQSVRQLYSDFIQWGNDTGRASKLATGAARYLQFLAKLDAELQQRQSALDGSLIVEIFTTEELRQMGLLSQLMAEMGLLNDNAMARRRRSDERLLAAKRSAIAGESWAEDIEMFEKALSTREPAISLRSHKAYMHAAIALLTQVKVRRATQVGQAALDKFVAKKPGLRASLSAFISHLNSLHELRLKLKPKSAKPIPLIRQVKYVRILIDGINSSLERPARLALTAKLLSKLLNAPLESILCLRHSDLDLKEFKSLKLDDRWCDLPERLRPIMAMLPSPNWLKGLDSDPLLFEGRILIDSLSTAAVEYHLKPVVRMKIGT